MGDFFSWCCGVATEEKLSSLVIQDHLFKEKIDRLAQGIHNQFNLANEQNKRFAEYDNKLHNTFNEVKEHLQSLDAKIRSYDSLKNTEDQQFYMYFINSYQNILRMSRTLHMFRNNEILTSCKNHLIPTAILTPEILRADLISLKNQLTNIIIR